MIFLDCIQNPAPDTFVTVQVNAGDLVFQPGSACVGFPVVTRGGLQIWLSHPSGRELLWYEVWPGEPCIASMGALLSKKSHIAYARAIEETELRLLPVETFQCLMADNPEFREVVLGCYVDRWEAAVTRLYSVAFLSVDQQLAEFLLHHGPVLNLSHQDLADRLNTAREVITRSLHKLEEMGSIELGRGTVRILDRRALRALVDPFHS